ncbi:hypothetical protein IFR35_15605 [Pseudomonas fluorescens]|uniref:hypothetical protein n=1 Tax=Pseudomonas fluorescens TaxID=294 RepID=UPI0017853DB5|nr:hypothetical protein [Pseudomonas fluorescens]MBD8192851.1 hypothetical protein [Pseudomonas fluorescens]MBD8227673.1 hypothetical protein [Pseudomonas fluorescens]MBD8785639.1 hypothetical protein [Pseudomonas fluorescens]MBD8817868.1 hypothetical protein [Pseudomonas fluorescens]
MKKYLVSGLGVSEGGVGRLMRNLVTQAEAAGFRTVARRTPLAIRRMLSQKNYIGVVLEILRRAIGPIQFFFKLQAIRNATVVFVHPQTVGFPEFLKLVNRNRVYLYVMDNSFFCIRSYNLHPELESECIRCLQGPGQALPACQPFPIPMEKQKNIEYLEQFAAAADKIFFLAQNASQAKLLRSRFGAQTRIQVVGLDTGELVEATQTIPPAANSDVCSYNLVFHGAPQLAKGLRYFVELAESLSEFSAFIPSSRLQCEQVLQRRISASNITFKACSWETGLMAAVQRCDLVVNPSLWSAPVEGALQKSIRYGGLVATVESQYGYEKEYEYNPNVIRLPRDVAAASVILRAKFPSAVFPSRRDWSPSLTAQQEKINIFDVVMNSES